VSTFGPSHDFNDWGIKIRTQETGGSMTRIHSSWKRSNSAGFTMMEAALTLAMVGILLAFGIPSLFSTVKIFELNAASDSITWAIQTTRYQAIMKGYPYQLTLNATNKTFQLASEPTGAGSFSNVGSAIPISGDPITLGAGTVLQFKGNGSVSATAGNSQTITVSYAGRTKTITVSNYGSITVQ
jgi:type IV fimbrial biogenesis protein FimT